MIEDVVVTFPAIKQAAAPDEPEEVDESVDVDEGTTEQEETTTKELQETKEEVPDIDLGGVTKRITKIGRASCRERV